MMSEEINAATICMNSQADKNANISEATKHIRAAAGRGARWILLPEMFAYMGPYNGLASCAEDLKGPMMETLSSLCRELGVTLFAGSLPESSGDAASEKVFNTMVVIGSEGNVCATYRKTHLFNLHDDQGKPVYCESDGFLVGDSFVTLELEGWQVGLAICYDLRFPNMFCKLGEKPLDVLVIPSAFTESTGRAHWELLLRARAVEYQCFVVASNQTGFHSGGKECFGHSMIIDPWGEVVCDTGKDIGFVNATLAKAEISRVRGRLPALANRRPELY